MLWRFFAQWLPDGNTKSGSKNMGGAQIFKGRRTGPIF